MNRRTLDYLHKRILSHEKDETFNGNERDADYARAFNDGLRKAAYEVSLTPETAP